MTSSFRYARLRDFVLVLLAFGVLGLLHLAALGILLQTEDDLVPCIAFVLAWAFLNCGWLALIRRPVVAGQTPAATFRGQPSVLPSAPPATGHLRSRE